MNYDSIRLQALQTAINEYMSQTINASEWEQLSEEELILKIEDFSVWEPFQDWPRENVISSIENLATSIEDTIIRCIAKELK